MASSNSDKATRTVSPPNTDKEQSSPSDSADREAVRQEIFELIAPYKRSGGEPPFTAEELLVMACLCSLPRSIDKPHIILWLLVNFKYFQDKAFLYFAFAQTGQLLCESEDVEPPDEVVEGFRYAFERWSVPLVADHGGRVHWDDDNSVRVPTGPGRMYLSSLLDAPRKGVFDFLALPAELRNTIYEMVFQLPSEIVFVSPDDIYVVSRPEEKNPVRTFADIDDDTDEAFQMERKDLNLSLLQVSKQIHAEAIPFFYRQNRFHCVELNRSVSFLHPLSTARLDHLTKLRLGLSLQGGPQVASLQLFGPVMYKLAQASRLRELEISVRDDEWLSMSADRRRILGRSRKFTSYSQIPGFADLARVCSKVERWNVCYELGDDARHELKEWVEAEVGRLNEEAKRAAGEMAKCKKKKGTGSTAVEGSKDRVARRKKVVEA